MCDGEDGAVFELSPYGGLNQIICLQVDSSCSLIQDEDPRLPQESSSQTHQLPLAHTAHTTQHRNHNTTNDFHRAEVCQVSKTVLSISLLPSLPEILSSLGTLQLQLCRLVADKLVKVRMLQSFPHRFIRALIKGVQVHPQAAREQNRLLWQKEAQRLDRKTENTPNHRYSAYEEEEPGVLRSLKGTAVLFIMNKSVKRAEGWIS